MPHSPFSPETGARVFVSCYRYDPLRRFLIRFLIPLVGIVALVGFLTLDVLFYLVVGDQIPPELRGQVLFVLAAIGFMGGAISLAFIALAWNLNRRYFGTTICCDEKGLRYQSGRREINADWDSVKMGRVIDLGRIQSATVKTPQGSFQFDPTYVDAIGPPPKIRLSFGGEILVYPDGTRVAFKIRENELFALVAERAGKEGPHPAAQR